jgi:hypothetical protein
MPSEQSVAVLAAYLETAAGDVLHRNFTTFSVRDAQSAGEPGQQQRDGNVRSLRFAPGSYQDSKWSLKQWQVLDGLKVNGAGAGYFEYRIALPEDLKLADVRHAVVRAELSAKQLLGKDRDEADKQEGNFMLGKGTHDPGLNRNAYPMTDTYRFPTSVRIRAGGTSIGVFDLPDDPADHRGILSWSAQKQDRHLHEAGSYGYLVAATIPKAVLQAAQGQRELIIRFEVDDSLPGGLAIYGERFGRYPFDPTVSFVLR